MLASRRKTLRMGDSDYDAAGNQTSGPKPTDETTRNHYTYDAWNRLVFVWVDSNGDGDHDAGETVIARYEYDALNRRGQFRGRNTIFP